MPSEQHLEDLQAIIDSNKGKHIPNHLALIFDASGHNYRIELDTRYYVPYRIFYDSSHIESTFGYVKALEVVTHLIRIGYPLKD